MPDPRLAFDLHAVLRLPAPRRADLAGRLAEDVLDGEYGAEAQHQLRDLLAPRRWRSPDPKLARRRLAEHDPDHLTQLLHRLA